MMLYKFVSQSFHLHTKNNNNGDGCELALMDSC